MLWLNECLNKVKTMRFPSMARPLPVGRATLSAATFADEVQLATQLYTYAKGSTEEETRIEALADQLSTELRYARMNAGGLDALLALYPLTSNEGRALMSMAEALPRIPDNLQADQLIREKLSSAQWHHTETFAGSAALKSNLAVKGLSLASELSRHWASEPLVRTTLRTSMDWLGRQFVMAETIYDALEISHADFLYSYDMLGESAVGEHDAAAYIARYNSAIHHIGLASRGKGPKESPGVSVKLSALHARYTRQQHPRVRTELFAHLRALAVSASDYNINFTLDAEESDRLDMQLALFADLARDPALAGWDGLGIAIQAYQKRAFAVIDWLAALAKETNHVFMVRLVKGAYWDAEIKQAQAQGLIDYPVFTHKAHTDISYLACTRRLLSHADTLYPQIATHNPISAAAAHVMAGATPFEFQFLFGMGEDLFLLTRGLNMARPSRIYAPIGQRATLLPYLVRRMLENGANSSFVHQIFNNEADEIIVYPKVCLREALPKPQDIFSTRKSAKGIAWFDENALSELEKQLSDAAEKVDVVGPILKNQPNQDRGQRDIYNPADPECLIGSTAESTIKDVESALNTSLAASGAWRSLSMAERATLLERAADVLEAAAGDACYLLVREAGKTLKDAHAELREAVDYCRYYALEARKNWPSHAPTSLGTVVTISPWNFPLAIYIGQIAAALVCGNCVIAKPSEKTPLIAAFATHCLLQAGIPSGVLQMLPGAGHIAIALLASENCHGVLFTGSLHTARRIRRQLSEHSFDVPLIAETGGINAMIVDSTVNLAQTVADITASAFNSAGQRCSSLRVLCVQEEIADALMALLKSAIQELRICDPAWLDCDQGPLIDEAAQYKVKQAISDFKNAGHKIWQAPFDETRTSGFFVPPTLVEIQQINDISDEIFGPVLCVLRYKSKKLTELLTEIASTGYGLTAGLQSRLNMLTGAALTLLPVGNYYVNRSQIGAVVESQPFGGTGLSGSGPKAGGPWYLWSLLRDSDACQQRYDTINTSIARKLDDYARQWPIPHESAQLIQCFNDYAHRSPLGHSKRLDGITGEDNTLSWRGRGAIACLGAGKVELIHQIGAALLTGNIVLLEDNPHNQSIASALNLNEIRLSSNPLGQPDLHGVLFNGEDARAINAQLAVRQGTIIPLISPFYDGKYPLYRLITEFTVSINTTATGGNLDLLSRKG